MLSATQDHPLRHGHSRAFQHKDAKTPKPQNPKTPKPQNPKERYNIIKLLNGIEYLLIINTLMKKVGKSTFLPFEKKSKETFKGHNKLFRKINGKASISSFSSDHGEIVNLDPELAVKSKQLVSLFEGLDQYDQKSILSYAEEATKDIAPAWESTWTFFTLMVQKLVKMPETIPLESHFTARRASGNREDQKPVRDNLAKIYLIYFQYVSKCLMELLVTHSEQAFQVSSSYKIKVRDLLEQRRMLNEFLLITFQNRKNKLVQLQYDSQLLQLILRNLKEKQDNLISLSSLPDIQSLATVFYFDYEALAILTSNNANKTFMKDAANESLRKAYELFERSLKNSLSSALLQEIYSTFIPDVEIWIPHQKHACVYLASQSGMKKFQVIHINQNEEVKKTDCNIKISLGYINLYYMYKIEQLMIANEIPYQKELTMKTLIAILKRNSDILAGLCTEIKHSLSYEQIESLLNENYICLKCMNFVLANIEDFPHMMEQVPVFSTLKSLLSFHLVVSLNESMVTPYKSSIPYTYKSTYSPVAAVFKFLHKLKYLKQDVVGCGAVENIKQRRNSIDTNHQFALVADEIAVGILENVTKNLNNIRKEIGVLKNYFVEFFAESMSNITITMRDHLHLLFESPLFHFTAPHELDLAKIQVESLNELNSKAEINLIQEFIQVLAYDKKWIVHIIQYILQKIQPSNVAQIFGFAKLLYSLITRQTYYNLDFFNLLFAEDVASLQHFINNQNSILADPTFLVCISAIIELNEMPNLFAKIFTCYEKELKNEEVNMEYVVLLEKFVMILHNFPRVCEDLLTKKNKIDKLLGYSIKLPKCIKFVTQLMRKCMLICKQSKCTLTQKEKGFYLPNIIANFICNNMKQNNTFEICLPFYDVLTSIFDIEASPAVLDNIQRFLFESGTWQNLLDIIRSKKQIKTEPIGLIQIKFLEYIRGLSYRNEAVKDSMRDNQIFSDRLITKGILEMLSEVIIKLTLYIECFIRHRH